MEPTGSWAAIAEPYGDSASGITPIVYQYTAYVPSPPVWGLQQPTNPVAIPAWIQPHTLPAIQGVGHTPVPMPDRGIAALHRLQLVSGRSADDVLVAALEHLEREWVLGPATADVAE